MFEKFIADRRPVAMRFAQTELDAAGNTLATHAGNLWFAPPASFRVEYDSANKPLVVSNGKEVWFYEADLKQAVSRPFSSVGNIGIVGVLSAEGVDALAKDYVLTAAAGDGLFWLAGEARDKNSPMPNARLGFAAAGELRRAEVTDAFGGAALLEILSQKRGELPADVFSFTPPPDADIAALGE